MIATELKGNVESITFRNPENGWTVASLKRHDGSRITIVGVMPLLNERDVVIVEGEIIEHPDYGKQLKVSSCTPFVPETQSDIEAYLASGAVKGIGAATAKLIMRQFGAAALNVLESEPERLTEINGIGKKRAQMIAESFAEQNSNRLTMMVLQRYGIANTLSQKILKVFGDQTVNVLRKNPYRLADEIRGIGFYKADEIAQKVGIALDSPFRIRCGLRYQLSEAANNIGHMYLPYVLLRDDTAHMLSLDVSVVENTLNEMLINGDLEGDTLDDTKVVYLPAFLQAERRTAERLLRQRASIPPQHCWTDEEIDMLIGDFEEEQDMKLCERQREAVHAAVQEGICILTGGPGTGKTTTINLILRFFQKLGTVELCAPTGRAAKRMSETTGCTAQTIHRLLGYGGEGTTFGHNEDEPLDADAVIVDEMSMVDIFLMHSLLCALRPGTRLLLVGDADQLPSVGAGNVLHDLISAGVVRTVCLTEIFRQAQKSHIVVNAHRINHGEYPVIQSRDTDFFLEHKQTATLAAESVIALAKTRLPKYLNTDDPLRSIQVMAPMKKGDAGVFALNNLLQEALNPADLGKSEIKVGDHILRRGDKVMQTRNNYTLNWEKDGETGSGVFNGDMGILYGVDERDRSLTVLFDDGRIADYDDSILDDLDLAYCMSVHKSQGSEFEAVVLPLVYGPPMLMTRNLLYTAVTRAKKLVVIVGRESCLRDMVNNNQIIQRYSALDKRLIAAAETYA